MNCCRVIGLRSNGATLKLLGLKCQRLIASRVNLVRDAKQFCIRGRIQARFISSTLVQSRLICEIE